jgi:biopolymer transport protein ExbB/TolQ/biopolymer transport protein ExbD
MNVFSELLISFLPGQIGWIFMWALLAIAILAAVTVIDRWVDISRRTDVDAGRLTEKIRAMLRDNQYNEAYQLCASGGRRVLPRVLGAGIKKAMETPEMIRSGMEEECLHLIPILEKRLNLIPMYGNASTLLGLMGTIYGLILAFAAVGREGVDPIQKSAMLAMGISAAMNTTLMGLLIAIPCVTIFSFLRGRIDDVIGEIDRYAVSTIKVLVPQDVIQKEYKVTAKRIKDEVDTDINIAPMMNLMVILIPLLLSSSEFVKMGEIEMKLPESSDGSGGGGGEQQTVNLDLGVVITSRGFNLFHYFRKDTSTGESMAKRMPDIPLKNGAYDYKGLNTALANVKKQALIRILTGAGLPASDDTPLHDLSKSYLSMGASAGALFADFENVKIVAEDTIKYNTVVEVMDAARAAGTPDGMVPMFPNVSLAGGIVP